MNFDKIGSIVLVWRLE